MKVSLPLEVAKIIDVFQKNKLEIYIVGGAVRDLVTGRIVDDWDFTTNATPQKILKLFPKGVYDNAFGTVMLPTEIAPSPFDITTFRTEHGYSDKRKPDKVKWGKNIKEDLQRRDFTINALALKIQNPNDKKQTVELIDLYQGQEDLENKLIRAVGNAEKRFDEDALRMMRAVRIASELGFTIEKNTLSAIKKNAKNIKNISAERVRDELLKTLSSAHPMEGMILFKDSGLMKFILPEMMNTFEVKQKSPQRHHIYDVGTHSLMSLKHCPSTDPIVRLAVLIHDVGKPATYKKLPSGIITFYNHELVSARIAKNIASRLKLSNKNADRLWRLVRYHQFSVNENQTDSAIRRFIRNVGLENVSDMLDLRTADRLGGGASETSWRTEEFKKRLIEVQKQPFSVTDLKISGHEVMKKLDIKPGPKVGEILEKLFKLVEDQKIPNEKKALLKKLKNIR